MCMFCGNKCGGAVDGIINYLIMFLPILIMKIRIFFKARLKKQVIIKNINHNS